MISAVSYPDVLRYILTLICDKWPRTRLRSPSGLRSTRSVHGGSAHDAGGQIGQAAQRSKRLANSINRRAAVK